MNDVVNLTPLALANLDQLADGDLGAQIKRNLEIAVQDVRDRGRDGKARKVSIHLTIGQRHDGKFVVKAWVEHELPGAEKIRGVTVAVDKSSRDPTLFFNAVSAKQPDQMTIPLPEDDDDEG